jgi:hypothetical protein
VDKINTLSTGEKLIAAGGIVILIASFLPWYSIDAGPLGSFTRNGWQSPGSIWSVLATLIGIAMAGAVLASRLGSMELPDLGGGNLTWGTVFLGGGALALLCVVFKFLNESSYISFGFFLGIIAAIALVAGGYLLYAEEKAGIAKR